MWMQTHTHTDTVMCSNLGTIFVSLLFRPAENSIEAIAVVVVGIVDMHDSAKKNSSIVDEKIRLVQTFRRGI